MMSLIRFLFASPLLGIAWGILEVARPIIGDVCVESHPIKQAIGFLVAGFYLIFALIGKAIAGKQPCGTRRYKWFKRIWLL